MGGRPWHRNRQRGSALLILTVFLVTAALAVFLKQLNQSASRPEYEGRSAAALAEAKEALIGKAAGDSVEVNSRGSNRVWRSGRRSASGGRNG